MSVLEGEWGRGVLVGRGGQCEVYTVQRGQLAKPTPIPPAGLLLSTTPPQKHRQAVTFEPCLRPQPPGSKLFRIEELMRDLHGAGALLVCFWA